MKKVLLIMFFPILIVGLILFAFSFLIRAISLLLLLNIEMAKRELSVFKKSIRKLF